MTVPRTALAVLLAVAGIGGACSSGGGTPASAPAAPAAQVSASIEEPTTTTTRAPLVVEAPLQPAQGVIEALEGGDLLDLSEPPVAGPVDGVDEFPEPLPEEAPVDGTGEAAGTEADLADLIEGLIDPDMVRSGETPQPPVAAEHSGRPLARASDRATPPWVLTRLAGEDDVAVRRAVAANPATPPAVLAELLADDRDPGVRWLAAANPSIGPETRTFPELLDEPPEPPERDDRLYVADNPGPWLDVLATLTEDIPARQWAAANRQTPAAALLALAGDLEEDVAVWVGSNPNAPPAALVFLTESRDPLACRAVSENPSAPPALLARIAGRALAGRAIAAIDRIGCQAAGALLGVARNPSSWPETLARLAADEDTTVRRLVAGNPATPPPDLDTLAADTEFLVRLAAAGNPATPPDALARLLADDDLGVRWEAATNPATPPDALAQLAAEPEALGRRAPPADPLPEQILPPADTEDETAQAEDEAGTLEDQPEEDTTTQ